MVSDILVDVESPEGPGVFSSTGVRDQSSERRTHKTKCRPCFDVHQSVSWVPSVSSTPWKEWFQVLVYTGKLTLREFRNLRCLFVHPSTEEFL